MIGSTWWGSVLSELLLASVLVRTATGFQATDDCFQYNAKNTKQKGVQIYQCGNSLADLNLNKLNVDSTGNVEIKANGKLTLVDEDFCRVVISNKGTTTSHCNVKNAVAQYENMVSACTIFDQQYSVGGWVKLAKGCNTTFSGDIVKVPTSTVHSIERSSTTFSSRLSTTSSSAVATCTPPVSRNTVIERLNNIAIVGSTSERAQTAMAPVYAGCKSCLSTCIEPYNDCLVANQQGCVELLDENDKCDDACFEASNVKQKPIEDQVKLEFDQRFQRAKLVFGPIMAKCSTRSSTCPYNWLSPNVQTYYYGPGDTGTVRYCSDFAYCNYDTNTGCNYPFGVSNTSINCFADAILASYCGGSVQDPISCYYM